MSCPNKHSSHLLSSFPSFPHFSFIVLKLNCDSSPQYFLVSHRIINRHSTLTELSVTRIRSDGVSHSIILPPTAIFFINDLADCVLIQLETDTLHTIYEYYCINLCRRNIFMTSTGYEHLLLSEL